MTESTSRRTTLGAVLALAVLVMPTGASAQDADGSPEGDASASPGSEAESSTAPSDDAGGGRLPEPLGECGGAELQILSVEAPFGEPLGTEPTNGSAEVEYLLPDGAVNAFISFSVPDAAGLSLQGSEILKRNPEAPSINPDASYSSGTMTATITGPMLAERTTASVDLVGASEATYAEKWTFNGVDIADFMDPPYAYGEHLDVFLTFELDGSSYSWSSTSSTSDCFVR